MTLRSVALSAARWTTLSAVARYSLQVLQVVVFARLLAPGDFGLVALATALTSVFALIADLGLGSALVHYAVPTRAVLSTLFWANLIFATALWGVSAAIGLGLEHGWSQPGFAGVVAVLALVLPLSAAGSQFRVLAARELRFDALAANEIVSALAGFGVALGLALAGAGVAALVAGPPVAAALSSALAWWRLSDGVRPGKVLDWPGAKPFFRFGAYKLGETFASALRTQFDVLVASTVATPAVLGLYSVPRDWMLKLSQTIVNPVASRVGLPLMSKVQDNPASVRGIYLQMLRLTATLNFPVHVLCFLFPAEIVQVVLGPRWLEAAVFLRLLAAWGLLRSIGNPVGTLLYATGQVRRAFWWNVTLLAAWPLGLYVGARVDGLEGIAWSMLAMQAMLFIPSWAWLVRPACGARLADMGEATGPAMAAALFAAGIAWMSMLPVPQPVPRLLGGAAVFAFAYLASSWWLNRASVQALLDLARPVAARLSRRGRA